MPTMITVEMKWGGVADHLRGFPEPGPADVVQREGEDDRQREPGDQRVYVEHQRVADDRPEVEGIDELLEVLEADPRTAADAIREVVVSEGNLHAPHREVLVDEEPDQRRQDHHPELPVTLEGLPAALAMDPVHESFFGGDNLLRGGGSASC